MAGKGRVADTHVAYFRECRLEGCQKLGFELGVDLVSRIAVFHIAADVSVEEDRVGDPVAVFAEATDRDVYIYSRSLVHYSEGDRGRRAVFVPDDLLGIEIVNSLILGGVARECKALTDQFEYLGDVLAQVPVEQRRLRGHVVGVFARLSAEVYDLALLDDYHTLAFGYGDYRAVGNDIVIASVVSVSLLAFDNKNICRNRITVEILLPLVAEYAAGAYQSCRN